MEHLATFTPSLIAALPASLVLVIVSAWWIFRR